MTKKEKNKALLAGCASGDFNKVRLALNFGADVNPKGNGGWTPLHLATYHNHIQIAKFLIDRGADVNAKANGGRTPLHEAVLNNATEVAKLLLDKGADVEAKNVYGNTPLDLARSDEMKDLFKKYKKRLAKKKNIV